MNITYTEAFGDDPRRLLRGQVIAGMLELSLYDIPRFRDAWVERHQNPDREIGIGRIVLAIYTESNGPHRDAMASKIFTMRAHELYYQERDDIAHPNYTTFYFNIPTGLEPEIINSLISRAVDPVDTDLRWTTVLGAPQRTGN